jgi:hypothetical protein
MYKMLYIFNLGSVPCCLYANKIKEAERFLVVDAKGFQFRPHHT